MMPIGKMKIAILGLGQIGASIGQDLIERQLVGEVIGYDYDRNTLRKAKRLKAVDRTTSSLEKAVKAADLTIIALPIRATLKRLPVICQLARPDSALLDVASTKNQIFETLRELDVNINYISGHPLSGNEGVGINASRLGMFNQMPFVLIPYSSCQAEWLQRITRLIKKIGANTFSIEPARHDQLTSLSIQTPYFLAYLLSRMAIRQTSKDKAFWDVTGGSIRGATRVMKSSAELTLDMLLTNKLNVIDRIDELSAELATLKSLLENENPKELARQIRATRKKLLQQS